MRPGDRPCGRLQQLWPRRPACQGAQGRGMVTAGGPPKRWQDSLQEIGVLRSVCDTVFHVAPPASRRAMAVRMV